MSQTEEKISYLEKEISEIKLMVMQQNAKKTKVSLKGSLKGLKAEENDIKRAKKSLFR